MTTRRARVTEPTAVASVLQKHNKPNNILTLVATEGRRRVPEKLTVAAGRQSGPWEHQQVKTTY